jgi:hypothetical protein
MYTTNKENSAVQWVGGWQMDMTITFNRNKFTATLMLSSGLKAETYNRPAVVQLLTSFPAHP